MMGTLFSYLLSVGWDYFSNGSILEKTKTGVLACYRKKIEDYLQNLICLVCKKGLEYRLNPECFFCNNCEIEYKIKQDIPIMKIPEGNNPKQN